MAGVSRQTADMVSHPEELPPCEGPRLGAFPYHNSPIEWLGRLDEDLDDLAEDGRQGYVFKVKIESHLYALKVFKFFNPEDTRFYWESLLEDDFPSEMVAFHTDPFYAECRAYGRINEAREKGTLKRQIAIPCRGFILLHDDHRRMLEKRGFNLDDECLDDDVDFWSPDSAPRARVRSIVKELTSQDSGVNSRNLKRILRDIKQLNKLEIYNRDIRIDNFRDGYLVDFGSARTEWHCFMHSADEEEAKHTKVGDLVVTSLQSETSHPSLNASYVTTADYRKGHSTDAAILRPIWITILMAWRRGPARSVAGKTASSAARHGIQGRQGLQPAFLGVAGRGSGRWHLAEAERAVRASVEGGGSVDDWVQLCFVRASSPVEVDGDKPTKKARTTAKPKKAVKNAGTCSMDKKQIGDRVKEALALNKYELNRTLQMDTAFFRTFFVDNDKLSKPPPITPTEFNDTTPVVVVEFTHDQAGALLGVSKVKGGNRFATTHLAAMCVVFYPSRGMARIWLSV
ncbi:Uncharacterized protein TPAR_02165 [Tolypocladium paradoxum]|uniref:Protein kinase domain-containing protein n=1 Tax=Tolypocladium paradoxum TaxID=94208 RepID=A0A2S4L5A6_9HYPO|nr:Uncharacterized protein TPAR_02165 [Tolypocladium paradoxum]